MRCNEVHEAARRRPWRHTLGVINVSGARIQNPGPSAVGPGPIAANWCPCSSCMRWRCDASMRLVNGS